MEKIIKLKMIVNSIDKEDISDMPNQPDENNQVVLEDMEPQVDENTNSHVLEKMKEIDQEVVDLFKKGRAFQISLEALWDIERGNIQNEEFLESIKRLKEEIANILEEISNKKEARREMELLLIHNQSNEGLDWQEYTAKKVAREILGLPYIPHKDGW